MEAEGASGSHREGLHAQLRSKKLAFLCACSVTKWIISECGELPGMYRRISVALSGSLPSQATGRMSSVKFLISRITLLLCVHTLSPYSFIWTTRLFVKGTSATTTSSRFQWSFQNNVWFCKMYRGARMHGLYTIRPLQIIPMRSTLFINTLIREAVRIIKAMGADGDSCFSSSLKWLLAVFHALPPTPGCEAMRQHEEPQIKSPRLRLLWWPCKVCKVISIDTQEGREQKGMQLGKLLWFARENICISPKHKIDMRYCAYMIGGGGGFVAFRTINSMLSLNSLFNI